MTRTLHSLLEDARTALDGAGLAELDWTAADVVAARRTHSGLVVGELGWGAQRVRFACVDRSVSYKLEQHGHPWQAGLSGSFAMRLVIHPRFGFQAEVYDVLTESLGYATSVERTAAVCARIERKGWTERQLLLPDPGVPKRVAVVSSPRAQGLSDFLTTVRGTCDVRVVEAVMGGDRAARTVTAAVRKAAVDSDLIVVLRGGGSVSSMEWADDENVVEAVATSPKPVWMAVGHADHHHLVDAVAQKSFATPTQAASELRRRVDIRTAMAREVELRDGREAARQEAVEAQGQAVRARRAAVSIAVAGLALIVVLLIVLGLGVI